MKMSVELQPNAEQLAFLDYIQAEAEKSWPAELARLRKLSLCAGQEVVHDLSMFDIPWSPVIHHEFDEIVAWVNKDGERRPGPHFPKN